MSKKIITPKEWLDRIYKQYPKYAPSRKKIELKFHMELHKKMSKDELAILFEKCWPYMKQSILYKGIIKKAVMKLIEK